MALRKWGAVRANSQLVKGSTELLRAYNDPFPNPLLETLVRGVGGALPPGYGSIVHGYGADANEYSIQFGYWPGIASGVLTINDATAAHKFLVTSGVLILDDGAAVANAAIRTPGDVLMVDL